MLDDLNAQVRPLGLQFAPDISTSNRATIGGMVANNSSGTRSLRYGKTIDHVLEVKAALSDGSIIYAAPLDPAALEVRCPPTTLLTLVENAVRHGIDPSEEGGRIDIDIERPGERCVIRVTDTGAGLGPSANGLGTGLQTLRERLRLIFGDAAQLRLTPGVSRGVAVEVDLPART